VKYTKILTIEEERRKKKENKTRPSNKCSKIATTSKIINT